MTEQCSPNLKVDYISRHKKDFSPYLRVCESLQLSPDGAGGDDGDAANYAAVQSAVVEGDDRLCSSDSETVCDGPAISLIAKKRSGLKQCSRAANMRRKGIPHRSPLC